MPIHAVIFTSDPSKVVEYGLEIIDKLYLLGKCKVSHDRTRFEFPDKNLTIDIRMADLSRCDGLSPRYWYADSTCDIAFYTYALQQFRKRGDEQTISMRQLIMTIIEEVLYGN